MTIQPHVKDLPRWVNEIKNCISVAFLTGSERHQLERLLKLMQAVHQVRPNIDIYRVLPHHNLKLAFHIIGVFLINGMHHRLIYI